jgi:hypothetical protein
MDFDATADNRSAQVIQVESLGKTGIALLTVAVIALIVSFIAWGDARRASDRAWIAEREARIAQDKYFYVAGELAKVGVHITTDGH